MEMQALAARLDPSPERGTLDEIIRDAGVCLREARLSVAGLRNSEQGAGELVAAIEQAARHITETQDVHLKLALKPPAEPLPADVQYNLLRIAQEALANSVKHSSGRNIEVVLDSQPQQLLLVIKDDGVGFDVEEHRSNLGHYGLIGMRERANQIGAELTLESRPGCGVTVSVSLPTSKLHHVSPGSNGSPSPVRSPAR
jgi:signal transduction histidine kinase